MNLSLPKTFHKKSGFIAIGLVIIFTIFTFGILLIQNAYPEIYEQYAENQEKRFQKEYLEKSEVEIMKIKSMNFK